MFVFVRAGVCLGINQRMKSAQERNAGFLLAIELVRDGEVTGKSRYSS